MLDASSTFQGRNPFLFVVGCPRSGTTLLQRMLDGHPLLAVANDSHFIPRCLETHVPHLVRQATGGVDVPLTPTLVRGVVGYHRYHRLGLDALQGRAAARDVSSYRDFVSALYDRFAARQGKPLGGEKTPDYVRRLPLLGGLFPGAHFVHIIRDGRDVALSVMSWANRRKGPGKLELWEASPLATSALWWAWQVGSGCRDGRALPGRYLEVHYERLVVRPEDELRRITSFLHIPFAGEMLRYHEGKRKQNPGRSAKSNWLPPTPGLRDWRIQMGAEDVALFEALTGELLDELGAERGCAQPLPQVLEAAADYRRRWQAHLERREAKTARRIRQAAAVGGSG